ncbi:YDG domain-containing protein, partial [Rhodoferax sp.]|uniref:YDG domain-containing protein n=1 Tax=Rhodoferax sp. TaxID=50421 RepID=UPI0025CFDE66
LGANVGNDGVISAQLGTVALAAGNAITLDVAGDGLLNVTVNEGAMNALAQNGGLIQADGGQVLLTSRSASALLPSAVNNTGVIRAQTLVTGEDGSIMLMGDMQSGTVNVGGTLDASAPVGGNGGFVETSAAYVKIANDVKITTAAAQGVTGNWLIDPVDFNIQAVGGDIAGTTLAQMLVTNNVTISTVETGSNTATNLFAAPGQGDINVNDAIGSGAPLWTATPNTTTLTLNAFRDVNVNAAITATNGNVVACCGRDVNVRAAITTTNGSVLLGAGRDVTLFNTGAITTTDGNITMCAGNDVIVDGKIVLTRAATVPSQSLGLADGLVLSAGNDGTGPGVAGGAVTIALRVDPSTVTDAPVTINYKPVSYTTPTDYSPATFFVRTRSPLTQHMLVFPDGGSKDYDGNTATALSGLKGNPVGVTLVAGSGSTANFDTPDVGIGKTVTFDGYSLAGANAAQYILPISCCAPVVARTTANINAVVVPPVVVPPVVVPPVEILPDLPYEGPIVRPGVTAPTWMPVVVPAGTPPELFTLAPPPPPAPSPVVVPPVLVVEQPPVIVAPEAPPEIYVAPKRAPKQDRN